MASSSPSSSSGVGTEYPHPIYMDHEVHTIPKLDRFSVSFWKTYMTGYLQGNGLVGFIDGSIQEPPETIKLDAAAGHEQQEQIKNPDYERWKEADSLVRNIITSTMQDEFRKQISPSLMGKNACQMWDFITKNVHRPPRMTHPDLGKKIHYIANLLVCVCVCVCVYPSISIITSDYPKRTASNQKAGRKNLTRYLPLYRAAVEGDVKRLEEILKKEPDAASAIITGASETALMIASQKKGKMDFVKKIIRLMSPQDLAMPNSFGQPAIFGAAIAGDVEAVKLMVDKNSSLPNIQDIYNTVPLHHAACAGRKDMVQYLLQVTNEKFLIDRKGFTIQVLIRSKFFGEFDLKQPK